MRPFPRKIEGGPSVPLDPLALLQKTPQATAYIPLVVLLLIEHSLVSGLDISVDTPWQ